MGAMPFARSDQKASRAWPAPTPIACRSAPWARCPSRGPNHKSIAGMARSYPRAIHQYIRLTTHTTTNV